MIATPERDLTTTFMALSLAIRQPKLLINLIKAVKSRRNDHISAGPVFHSRSIDELYAIWDRKEMKDFQTF